MNSKTAKLLKKCNPGTARFIMKKIKRGWYETPWKERTARRRKYMRILSDRLRGKIV